MHFKDRHEAGIRLAEQLKKYRKNKDVVVLAIPRGGVEIGYEIAKYLNVKLDIIVTKKIGLPDDEEFAIGSIGPDKKAMLDEETIGIYNISQDYINERIKEIGKEIERRYKAYKGKYKLQNLKNKLVILTDDGIATGFTTKVAVEYIKSKNPKKIILAIPVAPLSLSREIKKWVDEFVCLHSTELLLSISQFYESFPQLTDEEVKILLINISKSSQLI